MQKPAKGKNIPRPVNSLQLLESSFDKGVMCRAHTFSLLRAPIYTRRDLSQQLSFRIFLMGYYPLGFDELRNQHSNSDVKRNNYFIITHPSEVVDITEYRKTDFFGFNSSKAQIS